MLTNILATLLSTGTSLLLLAIVAAVATATLAYALCLQSLYYRRGLRRYLRTLRQKEYQDAGLRPSWRLLFQMTTREANQILSGGTDDMRGVPRLGINLGQRMRVSLANPDVFADFSGAERAEVSSKLSQVVAALERRWIKVFSNFTFLTSLGICAAFQYDAIAALNAAPRGIPVWLGLPWHEGSALFYAHGVRWQSVAGVLLSAFVCALISAGFLRRWLRSLTEEDQPKPVPARSVPPEEEVPPIGRPGQPIRAISFSAGGFDTLMDLGVMHALIVIQARAPDAVVGLSAGAVHAALLAEVLQAGDDAEAKLLDGKAWRDLTEDEQVTLQRMRLLARVKRLRHFIENAQRAHERLIGTLLPDAYQIDVAKPLQPLAQPRFALDERNQRREFVIARSGLARLYNDVMNVPLRISTITKVVRRLLGLIAANEILSVWRRSAVCAIEAMRLWVLVGANLIAVAKLSRILLRPFIPTRDVKAETAAAIIFYSRAAVSMRRGACYVGAFMVSFAVWTALSAATLLPLWLLAIWVLASAAVYKRDPNSKGACTDALQGVVAITGLTAVAMLLAAAVIVAVAFIRQAPIPALIVDLLESPLRTSLLIWLYALVISCAVVFIASLMLMWTRGDSRNYFEHLLDSYGLGDAIFREHGLRAFFAEMFDQNYYARPELNRAVEAALHNQMELAVSPEEASQRAAPKLVNHYSSKSRLLNERMHVGIAVANTASGSLEVVPHHIPVVDALMAAMAAAPWLPPVILPRIDKDGHVRDALYVDGANVTREPSHALLKMLRRHRTDHAGHAYMYAVSPFPLSKAELGDALRDDDPPESIRENEKEQPGRKYRQYLDLVDIVWRAMRLQRFRDARLGRRLTELFSDCIPESQPVIHLGGTGNKSSRGQTYLRVWVAPVELEYDADLNRRLYRAGKDDRRRIVKESIADGCRAALQVMIPDAIKAVGKQTEHGKVSYCMLAVQRHMGSRGISDKLQGVQLPGSNPELAPGLSEICEHCTLNRRQDHNAPLAGASAQSLRLDKWDETAPSWPHERQGDEPPVAANKRFRLPESSHGENVRAAWKHFPKLSRPWPRPRTNEHGQKIAGNERPTISLLFSGGVFRGVYQVGVLNGLHELDLKPDLIAGASVGSITGAMIAEAFSLPTPTERHARIARLSGVYLAIDRLILTDRFADFVRNLTLRAAETRFSIRHVDRVFRKYDYPGFMEFDRTLRRVVAGIERLLYVGPYQLNELIRCFRARDTDKIPRLLEASVQRFLDRMQIGDEALGAEALRELVEYYVIGTKSRGSQHSVGLTLDELRDEHGMVFLATATNLTRGRLEVLGEAPSVMNRVAPTLTESLLASSAFPGIFRPRWSWEILPGSEQVHQFIDGGVMDNLPIDAIAGVLHNAAAAELVMQQPSTPHLIIGASLEVRAPAYAQAFTRDRFRGSWVALRRRATQLGYNRKLDSYQYVEQALRNIRKFAQTRFPHDPNVRDSRLVGIKLISIKPNLLSGTFAFHPMLGFRRTKQARSIAHGCATTLLEFANIAKEVSPDDLASWGIKSSAIPDVTTWNEAFARPRSKVEEGRCWLRNGIACPFAKKQLEDNDKLLAEAAASIAPAMGRLSERPLGKKLIEQVSEIHRTCGDLVTHLREI